MNTTNLMTESHTNTLDTTREQRYAFRQRWKQLMKEGAHKPTWADNGPFKKYRISSDLFTGLHNLARSIILGRPHGKIRYNSELGATLRDSWRTKRGMAKMQEAFPGILSEEQWKLLTEQMWREAPAQY